MKNEQNEAEGWVLPTPQSLVLGEIDALHSFWPLVSDDPDIGPRQAVNVLAAWAHVRRFPPESIDKTLVERLNELVQQDLGQLAEAALLFDFPVDWAGCAEDLDEVWDSVGESDQIDDLERSVRELFYSLDRFSLAFYAVEKLVPDSRANSRFIELRHRLENAEEYVHIKPDVFLSAAVYASTLFNAYRSDLFEFDEKLWETTLKHRQLQELLDERESPPSRQPLPTDLRNEFVRVLTARGNRIPDFLDEHILTSPDPEREDSSFQDEQSTLTADSVSPNQLPAYVERVNEIRSMYLADSDAFFLSATPDISTGIPNAGSWKLIPNIEASVELKKTIKSGTETLELEVIASVEIRRQFVRAEISFEKITREITLAVGKGGCEIGDFGSLKSVVLIANQFRYQIGKEILF